MNSDLVNKIPDVTVFQLEDDWFHADRAQIIREHQNFGSSLNVRDWANEILDKGERIVCAFKLKLKP